MPWVENTGQGAALSVMGSVMASVKANILSSMECLKGGKTRRDWIQHSPPDGYLP
ncbi:hypothetical protein [Xylella taiwanensis]|uniref:hypothetical protein n=1 Tax=Xylella taiwanensis TaxID=1444770 RepID=UPI001E645857|nr:hypothetical protein [Xylella taiwanensis]